MHRLRDLDRRQGAIAMVLVAALVVPFVVSVARARSIGWLPSGDDALIGLRALDVLGGHLPLVGQPSTSHLYGPEAGTSHPGPIEFYWLALPVALLGPSAGMILGSAAVNLASVLTAAWVALRRGGPGVGAWSAVLLSAVLWSQGTALLSDPISSNAGAIPLLALAALAWAVVDGDVRLLPPFALVGSWVVQQHLAISLPGAVLVVFGLGALGVAAWRDRDDEERPRRWPWVAGAAAIAAVVWAPVLWQQATGSPGNVSAVVTYARTSESATVGLRAGLRQAVRAMGVPPLLTRSDLRGDQFFRGPVAPWEVVAAVLSYAALVAVAVRERARCRALSLLATTALVLALAGVLNGSAIPLSIEAYRPAFYRWTFVVAWLAWTAIGWAIGREVVARRALDPAGAAMRRLAPVAAVLALVPAAATVLAAPGWDDERRDEVGYALMREAGAAAVDATEPGDRVTLVFRGRAANLSAGASLAMYLQARGREVLVTDQEDRFYGEHRTLDSGGEPGDVHLLLLSGLGELPDLPGERLAGGVIDPDAETLAAGDLAPNVNLDDRLELRILTDEELDQVIGATGGAGS